MPRHCQTVSKAIQELAAGLHLFKNEGMFPYETHYVLATDEEVDDSTIGEQRRMSTCPASGIRK
jgi:hypothetical protein